SLCERPSSAAWRVRSSRVCRTPERRSFLRTGISSSVGCCGLLRGQLQGLRDLAGETWRLQAPALSVDHDRQMLEVEALAHDVLYAAVAVQAVEAGASTGCWGAGDREGLEVRDDRLDRAQLREHVVGVEDLADERADVFAERVGTLLPEIA